MSESRKKALDTEDGPTPSKVPKIDMSAYIKEGYQVLKEATVTSNALPIDTDYNYYKTHDSFNRVMKNEADNILGLMNNILKKYNINDNIRNRTLDEKSELLIEGNDAILERVSMNIDDMNGIKRTPVESVVIQTVSAQVPINGSWNRFNKTTFSVGSANILQGNTNAETRSVQLIAAQNIVRPQKFFKDIIDNGSKFPWMPRIKEKPNSLAPLALFLEETENGQEYSHPYEFELDKFQPQPEQLTKVTPENPKPLSDTPLIEISTPEGLNELLDELRTHKEIAIDLEHHSYRTFMGITCLMQISTRDTDYIIDTLALRDKLHVLNEVFTKPTIIKIFHGADSDIQWLQRDLSLYVVNMFDTHRAAKQLGYSGLSLAYLLQRFCKFIPNKKFQLADWRIRPLPEELKNYAREDTHYLLYIYHMLRNELINQGNGNDNILKSVIDASTDICKKRYFKPVLTDDSHMEFYRKCKRMFDNRQMYALKELYKWRDTIAREEDESTGYVLPNHMMLQIAETLPKEMQGILACCSPIPPLVKANLLELHQIVLRAREQSLQKPIMKEDNRSRGSTHQISKLNINSPLHCPHDLTKIQEFRDDLPTLLGSHFKAENGKITASNPILKKVDATLQIEKETAKISVFNTPENSEDEEEVNGKLRSLKFLGPYERYKLVKPFLQAEEEKAQKEKDANPNRTVDDPSDEDRIASLHAHFVKVAKETHQSGSDSPPSSPDQQKSSKSNEPKKEPLKSLVEMGGKKRKRQEIHDDEDEHHHNYDQPQNEFHTSVPKFFSGKNFFNKSNWNTNGKGNNSKGDNNSPKKKQKRKRNTRNKQDKSKHFEQDQDGPQMPESSRQNKNQQQHGDIKPFDFSSVDYKQFQGGARAVNTGGNFKSNFRGKNKNKRKGGGKQNNKSFTFGAPQRRN